MKKNFTRLLQKHVSESCSLLIYKISSLSLGGKISLGGIGICLFSLFLPWIIFIQDGNVNEIRSDISSTHSFSGLIGHAGFFICIALITSFFFLFSQTKKNTIHSLVSSYYKIHALIFIMSIFIIYSLLQSLFTIKGLQTFAANIAYGKGIILCLTGAIILIFGAIRLKHDMQENNSSVYLHKTQDEDIPSSNAIEKEKKKNMKLPF